MLAEGSDAWPLPTGVIGRDIERAAINARLASSDRRARAVVLTGAAGIGKTALWESAVTEATVGGAQVLVSRASAAEARFPWVGLTDLLRAIPSDVVSALPQVQRRALEAVALQGSGGAPLDERTVATALLSALGQLTQTAPLLLAIDDLPYLDGASAAAVAFAMRRLSGPHSTRLLATVRSGGALPAMLRELPADCVEFVEIGPMSVAALFELLSTRLAVRLARPLLLRVHETSAGNPLYALELARALDRLEIKPKPGCPLPVPVGLTALVAARVQHLPDATREIVAATAATWRFTGRADDDAAIDEARRAGLVVVDDPMLTGGVRVVRAAHPLISAAAYDGLSDVRRRALHARLAEAAEDPVERVRHLALVAAQPRGELALELDVAVEAAITAGVPDVAVELAQLSLAHTVDPGLRPARLDRLADAQLRAGDSSGAWHTQSAGLALTTAAPERARRRIRLAEIATEVTGAADAESELRAAVLEAEGDPVVLAEALLSLAAVTEDIDLSDVSARRAVELLEAVDHPDPVILSGALAQAAGAQFRTGHGLNHDLFARAIDLERRHPARRISDRADASYAALLKYADDLDGAQVRLEVLLSEARGVGDLSSIAYALAHLAHVAAWRGRLDEARVYAEEHLAVTVQGELVGQGEQARSNLGLVLAYQGGLEDAAAVLNAQLSDPHTSSWGRHRVHALLGFVALSRRDAVIAAGHLDHWHAALTQMHFGEPGYSRGHLDYLCALVGSGRLADAVTFQVEVEGQALRSGRGSALAVARTGSAMIEAAAGRTTAAQDLVTRALDWYDESPLRFDRARTLLVAGQIHRRAKAKSEARDLLTEAEHEFASFGAVAWQAQAAAELARVNVRPGAPSDLTATERRVAELAASGMTNREVASSTFLAVKTVESNLARAYRKLGIRSRAELGARLGHGAVG